MDVLVGDADEMLGCFDQREEADRLLYTLNLAWNKVIGGNIALTKPIREGG